MLNPTHRDFARLAVATGPQHLHADRRTVLAESHAFIRKARLFFPPSDVAPRRPRPYSRTGEPFTRRAYWNPPRGPEGPQRVPEHRDEGACTRAQPSCARAERADHGMVRAVHAGETPVHASGGSVPLRMQPCTSSAHLTARTPRRNRRADDAHPSPPSCSEAHGARTAAQANRTTEPLIETKTYPSGTALTSIARDSRRRRT